MATDPVAARAFPQKCIGKNESLGKNVAHAACKVRTGAEYLRTLAS
jgi:hypothetical protein